MGISRLNEKNSPVYSLHFNLTPVAFEKIIRHDNNKLPTLLYVLIDFAVNNRAQSKIPLMYNQPKPIRFLEDLHKHVVYPIAIESL